MSEGWYFTLAALIPALVAVGKVMALGATLGTAS